MPVQIDLDSEHKCISCVYRNKCLSKNILAYCSNYLEDIESKIKRLIDLEKKFKDLEEYISDLEKNTDSHRTVIDSIRSILHI